MIAALPSSLFADLPLAIAAGFVSFVSPCVLPLLPGYVAFLTGSSATLTKRAGAGRAFFGSLAFILGFSIVFISAGALFGGLGASLRVHERGLEEVFGVVTIALGLFFGGWWPSRWLQRERRLHTMPPVTVLGAAALGFTFGLGWSPCLGPTLAAILALAGAQSDASALRGSLLALFYCFGLGIPFMVAAIATEWMAGVSTWFRKHSRVIGWIGGAMLIVVGVCEVTGWWQDFILWLQVHLPFTTSL